MKPRILITSIVLSLPWEHSIKGFLAAMGFLLLAGPASAEWKIEEKQGELRVANGKIGVVLMQEAGQPASITLQVPDAAGTWQPVCRTLRPDFTKTPAANKLFDTSVTPHRFQANQVFTEFSVASRSDEQVKIKLRGKVQDRVVAEQILTLDRDSASLHVDVSASLHEPLLDYFMSTWEFLPSGAPDFVHSPTIKKNDPRWPGPAEDQVIGDHAFHSPAIVLQKGGLYACMVPDLATRAYGIRRRPVEFRVLEQHPRCQWHGVLG